MRLTSLEIKGFKSFADETVIHFNEDIIGIVGPNGSGKSNIVDAIRWVLGEQKSRELRLEKMSNIIFNGSKKRKRGGMAQVSLTFENTRNLLPTEYHTVTISRFLFRSGDSEYRLNNVPCRLKDITSLFLDTGIGSNSYAIIALGMVDDLLSDKDNSRRRMFEQAAGISKYKKRKHQTLLKLKNTSEDLDRVEDLLFEIENNLKQLEKQARRARRYFELKEKYKGLSIELAAIRLSEFRERHHKIKQQLGEEEEKYRQLGVEFRTLEAGLEKERKLNLDKEKLLSERQTELNQLTGHIRDRENDKRILQQKRDFILQNQVKLAEQIKAGKVRSDQLRQEIESHRSRLTTEKQTEAQLEQQLESARDELNRIRESHGAIKSDLDGVMRNQQVFERAIFELEKQKAVNLNQVDNLTREIAQNAEALTGRKKEAVSLDAGLAEVREQIHSLRARMEVLLDEEARRREELVTTEGQIEEMRKKIADVNRSLDARRNEHKLTKSMVENLEGFPESIRFLNKHKEWGRDAPLLSDLIYCREEFRIAIENYLEPYLNYYVVRNLEEAYKAVQLLNRSQKGKANFFLLDAFEDYVPPMVLLPNTRQAIEQVETDPQYRKLVSYLLENVLITEREDLTDDLEGKDVVLLSPSGSLIRRKFSLSGGSVGLFEGKKIGRKKNLEVLEKAIQRLEKEENKLAGRYYELVARMEHLKGGLYNQEIGSLREKLSQLGQQEVSLMTRLENTERFLRDAGLRIEEAEKLIDGLQSANHDIDRQLAEKQAAAKEVRDQISHTDDSFRQAAEQLSSSSAAYNEKHIEFIRRQNLVSGLQREVAYRERQLEETAAALNRDQHSLEALETELVQNESDQAGLEETLLSDYDRKREKETALQAAEQAYFQGRGGINEIEDKLRQLNQRMQHSQTIIGSLKDKYNEIRLELTSIGERLRIEFGLAVEEVMQREPSGEISLEELEQKVERIKGRLDNYGEVNPMAVEAYDEMKERYDTISAQRNDILEAKKSLLETISEIEQTATARFLDAFGRVREYFQDVFRTLFTEDDNCDLLLEDEHNPLESTIQIIAKPKGKKPQSINQLSGGEKTLTATALLFALYLLKPAPFCIFDEVDAPLDDANIEKFNRIVRKFSRESQFVIVTHNKATMAAVDVIYGVYMQEQGVSNVSAVDFRELEHDATLQTVS